MNSRECNEYYVLESTIASLNSRKYDAIKECNKKVYEDTMKYFEKKDKYELLNYIYKNIDKVDTFTKLLENFAQEPGGDVITRQHVFESMCQIFLFTNCDNLKYKPKNFYSSFNEVYELKDFRNDILGQRINEGNTSDVSDIYFTSSEVKVSVSCKYFLKEKNDEKHYDVFKTKGRAGISTEVLLFVNNKEKLNELIQRKKRDDFSNTEGIYGMTDFEFWYSTLLNKLKNGLDEFINSFNTKTEKSLNLRFHQQLCSNSVSEYIKNGSKSIIIGAVARSGKSYMVADLVKKRNRSALIILGAKTETEQSFYEIFENHSDFDDFKIEVYSGQGDNRIRKGKNKKIVIVSQDSIKETKQGKLRKAQEALNDMDRCDIYYDEIHKGGTTSKTMKTLDSLKERLTPDIFVMITATFTKPQLKYSTNDTKIFTWSYQDIQNMKTITEENYQDIIKDRNEEDKQKFEELLDIYKKKYNDDTFTILREEYSKYPELVLLDQKYIPIEPDYNFSEDSDKKKLLSVMTQFYKKLVLDKIYNPKQLHSEIWFLPSSGTDKDYEEINIENVKEGKEYKILSIGNSDFTKIGAKKNEVGEEFKANKKGKGSGTCVEKGIINVNSDLVCNAINSSPSFKKSYNLYICNGYTKNKNYINTDNVHYWKEPKEKGKNEKLINISITKDIERFEKKTYDQGKSLIILTGDMLRLGVSLKNVTIGVNLNNIQSFDVNFQTMFRVLTEKTGKDYGIYLDMNEGRSYKILLQYAKILKKTDSSLSDNEIKKSLFTFNYNGVSLSKLSFQELTEISDSAMTDIGEYMKKNRLNQTFKNDLKGFFSGEEGLNILSNIDFGDIDFSLTEKSKKYGIEIEQQKIGKTNLENKERKKRNNNLDEREERINTEMELKIDIITFIIRSLQIFNEEYECRNILECINNSIEKGKGNEFEKYCKNCNDPIGNSIVCLSENKDRRREISEIYLDGLKSLKNELSRNEEFYEKLNDNFKGNINLPKELKILENKVKTKDLNAIQNMVGKKVLNKNTQPAIFFTTGDDKSFDKIQEKIEKYLPIREREKKSFGEVMTPPELIIEMLQQLPIEVWSNPNLTWLDPANGTGNFPIYVYYGLMVGLEDKIKDPIKRSERIINNMLYMVELNSKNVAVTKRIFGKDCKIYCGSFLPGNKGEPGWKGKFEREVKKGVYEKVERFDIIIGNPPYQDLKVNEKKSTNTWPYFVKNSIKYLKENGYLVFVHPSGWRNIDGNYKPIFNLIQERELQYLTMRSFKDGAKTFKGSGTNFDYYCLKNKLNKKNKTKINDIDRKEYELDLNDYEFIPSGRFDIFDKLIKGREKVSILYSSNNYETRPEKSRYPTSKDKKEKFIYKVINSITKKDGPKFIYTTTKNEMFIPKVIWSNGAGTYPIIDKNGDYGLTQFSYGIVDKPKNLKFIKNAMDDPNFIDLMKYVKFSDHKYNHKIIGSFKKDFWKEFDYK